MEQGNKVLALTNVLVAIMLAIGIDDLLYGYYTFIRIAVFIISIIDCIFYFSSNNLFFVIPHGAIAILFNPIIPIYLDKSTWVPIDVGCAIFFVISALIILFKKIE